MDFILQLWAFTTCSFIVGFIYILDRLGKQDKYLSNHIRGLSQHLTNGGYIPPRMKVSEVKVKKPEVYSPRHDTDTIMRGKVIDPFD